MNDFSEIESELQKLHPVRPSAELLTRVEKALVESTDMPVDNIVRTDRFRIRWLALGAGLAAAAVVLLFFRIDFQPAARPQKPIAAMSPTPAVESTDSGFVPAAATQVVYHTRDEGLFFHGNAEELMRRRRSITRETLRWHNAATGASIRVSYPSEQVELIPVSYQ